MTKQRKALFVRGMFASVFVIILAILILRRGEAHREKFQKVSGEVTYVGSDSPDGGRTANAKKRYLVIDYSPLIFEIFIGNDPGDFSPAFQEIDSIKIGDHVDLYHDESRFDTGNAHNNLTYFIDMDGRNMFRKGPSDRGAAWVLLFLGIGLMILLLLLKRRDKII